MPRGRKKAVETTEIAMPEVAAKKPVEAPKPKAIKKVNPTVEAAIQSAKDLKSKEETVNPPHWREMKAKDFSGMDMKDMLNTKHIKNYDFRGCNLDGADFTGMIVQGCKFAGASLDGTIFVETDLRWSDFTGADYSQCVLGVIDDAGVLTRKADTREVDGMTR